VKGMCRQHSFSRGGREATPDCVLNRHVHLHEDESIRVLVANRRRVTHQHG